MIEIGIVGLPNVGKSTIFNSLCGAQAKVSNYAFCTVEPNRAVVPVPDPRLARVAEIFGQERAVPVTATFVDIAGLVRGASKGEGLGNQFLAHIREVDAILHVVRCFADAEVSHIEGDVNPTRDAEIVDIELALADLGTVQRRLEKARTDAKSGNPDARAQVAFLERLSESLNQGTPARLVEVTHAEAQVLGELHLLTAKRELYVANVGEDGDDSGGAGEELREYGQQRGSHVLELSGKIQAELAELPDAERDQFAREMDVPADALEKVVAASYNVLELVTFFTAVGKEARAWPVRRGTTAAEAAGQIHTDMEKGFVRAEVIGFDVLDRLGSWDAAHQQGLLRVEGRDYAVEEGDVIHVRFAT
ncbi:MAG: redox-regulated ATPase YchF [Armatimonadota bacterium]|nr:MAG: redox-regulated ATPase YchF [Armatimonadota bacterium]